MKLITDHARWCDACVKRYLSVENPGVELFGGERSDSRRVLCLHCVNAIRDALMAQVAEDMAREFGNLHHAPKG